MNKYNDQYQKFVSEHEEQATRIQALVDRGRSHLERGAKEDARRDFHRALLLFPHVPAALNNLALMAFADGDQDHGRAFLEDLLSFDENEPTANALMARYWADAGAPPLAAKYALAAAESVLHLSQERSGSDPSRVRRSLEYVYQALARLGQDADLVRLHRAFATEELLLPTSTQIGIAMYNRGDFSAARTVWKQAAEEGFGPAQAYLDMQAVIEEKELKPFSLDHVLEVPQPEKGRQVWLSHVPTLFLAAAVRRVYRGQAEEAEEALSLLAGAGVSCMAKILVDVGSDITRPPRLRLLAILHMVAAGDLVPATQLAEAIERSQTSGEDEGLWCLVHGLLAEAEEEKEKAGRLALEGLALFAEDGEKGQSDAEPIRTMLKGLAHRTGVEGMTPPGEGTVEASGPNGETVLQLPDAEWLRNVLKSLLALSLEEVLAKRSSQLIDELAHRLGESNVAEMPENALIRRLAVRMRSLQLERVLRALPGEGRALLAWLDSSSIPISLPELYNHLAELSSESPWQTLEALYRAGVIDIGLVEAVPEGVPAKAEQLAVAIPDDLRGRFASE